MSNQTCTVDESATARSGLWPGMTAALLGLGTAGSQVLLAVSTLLMSSAAGSSAVDSSIARLLDSQAIATAAVSTQLDTTSLLTSGGAASSQALAFPTAQVLEQGVARGVAVLGSDHLVQETGLATSAVSTARRSTGQIVEQAAARSVLLAENEVIAVAMGQAVATAVPRAVATETLQATAAARVDVFSDARNGALAESVGTAASFVSSQLVSSVVVDTAASGAAEALLRTLRDAWVMNTETTAMSRYTGLPIQSVALIGTRVLALGDLGLYELLGPTDDGLPVQASVKTGRSTFGIPRLKRISEVVIGYVCSGIMTVRVSVYGGKEQGTFSYDLPPRVAAAPRANSLKVGKGLASLYWQFEFVNKDGASFSVDSVTADIAPSVTRRT